MQSSGGQRNNLSVEPGFVKARQFIQDRIYEFLKQRQKAQEIDPKKVMEIVKRLEEGLFKTATTKEEYMNLETLESRLFALIRSLPLSNQNQQYQQQGNTSIPMGTMIPNSGMPQSENSSVEPGFVKARQFIQERIYDFVMQRPKPQEIDPKKVMEIVKRLEEGLFKTATTKEEYMNLETLENRLYVMIRGLPLSNQNQQYQQQGNTSVPMGTMIPSSCMPQSENSSMEPGFVKARQFIQERIYEFLKQRQKAQEIDPKKVMEIVKRLEEGLFKTATTKEEYMNLETLESRLFALIRSLPLSNQNQQYQQQGNTSIPMGTMIPNSGMPQSENSSVEPGFVKARQFIQERIYDFVMQRPKAQEIDPKKVMEIVKRLEEGLFKTATTKEEYMNLETLENRLYVMIRGLPLSNQNQQYQQQGNTSVPMGTMIPSSCMPQSENSSMEPGFVKARQFIQERIYDFLMQRQKAQEIDPKKVMEIVKRLEEGLFKTATTKEEYMNLETLENRLYVMIRGLPLSNQNQQYQQQGNTSVPMGTMIPNSGMPQSENLSVEPGFVKARQFIQERIYDFLMQRQKAQEIDPKKVMEIVKRLEEGLFKTATTKEEYMNLETLENRLYALIRGLPLSNQNQQYQQPGNTFVPMGTMIPNSGMPQSGNSSIMVASSMDNSFVVGGGNSTVSSSVNTRNLLPNTTQISSGMHNGSLGSSDGGLMNGYQPSTTKFSGENS